jgi:hypothetical protein
MDGAPEPVWTMWRSDNVLPHRDSLYRFRYCGSSSINGVIFNLLNINMLVGYEVSTAVTMKNALFWDVTPCGSCKNRRFGGTQRLHHQGDKNRLTLFLVHPFF